MLRRSRSNYGREDCCALVSEFYRAVQDVFRSECKGHTPKTSRLVHGAGIVALGYVMEVLALLDGARRWEEFAKGLGYLPGRTAWASGEWDFGDGDRRHWKAIQNVHRDIITLRSEEHTSELQSLMRISYAVFCLKKKKN